MSTRIGARVGMLAVALSTAVLIVAVGVLPFLSPAWLALAQDRADVTAWTGYTPDQVRTATDALLHDLVLGPPDFSVAIDGQPVLGERERSHLRDVRGVFGGLAVLAIAAVVVLLVARLTMGGNLLRRAVRSGALGLAVGTVVLGVVAAFAFDAAFELFHELLFAGGTWTFDPQTDRLVQLFPWQLWFETSLAAGALIVGLALLTAGLARPAAGRARRPAGRPSAAGDVASVPSGEVR